MKVKGWKETFYTKKTDKSGVDVSILLSDKIEFKTGNITRDKEGHLLKGSAASKRYKNYKYMCT